MTNHGDIMRFYKQLREEHDKITGGEEVIRKGAEQRGKQAGVQLGTQVEKQRNKEGIARFLTEKSQRAKPSPLTN